MKFKQIIFLLFLCFLVIEASAAIIISNSDFKPQWRGGWNVPGNTEPEINWQRVGTEGNGEPVFVISDIPATNLVKKIINFHCRVNRIDTFKGIEIRFSESRDFKSYFYITLKTFAKKSFNILQPNEWHNISYGLGNAEKVGSPSAENIRYIGIYLQDNTLAPVIFDFSDIQILPANNKAMLSYTFDDGYDDHMIAADIMKLYGHHGTVYIIPEAIGRPGYMTLGQLKQLQHEGWGISAHNVTPFTQLKAVQLKEELNKLLKYFKENDLGAGMNNVAYPLGEQNRTFVVPIVRKVFDTARLASGGMETLPPGDYALLRTYNVLDTTTVDELRKEVRKAKANNQWLILMFHYLSKNEKEGKNELAYSIKRFREVVKMIDEEKIEVAPVHKVFERLNEQN